MLSAKQERPMAINVDQSELNAYLEAVLEAFKDGKLNASQARNDVAQAVSMAAIDNVSHFEAFIKVAALKSRWGI